jgi:hypothetical protein
MIRRAVEWQWWPWIYVRDYRRGRKLVATLEAQRGWRYREKYAALVRMWRKTE